MDKMADFDDSPLQLLDGLDRDLLYLTIGNENISITITYGKIEIWLGRRAKRDEIRRLIADIADIDPGLGCEIEFMGEFSEIERMEGKGLILTSYRRSGDGYRAIFLAPLAKEEAVECLLDAIDSELKRSDTVKTIHWGADDGKIKLLVEKLSSWRIWKSINIRKRESRGDVSHHM
ncbi:MAG TPA: hypothetical protein ENG09_03535 [Candidatus Syntrophoarchaeum butanivorans]|uniref:Uncharacterized protein n=1 Tax=Candidatus Syntropharchaeum butanivorans TaxID=1839936 RepID=A0A7C1B5R6_9EURY|nr:hypothetical protein [Candidatus Syntrophoarchaeum butanivorans]